MGARVLVCDDEPGLREMLGVLLRRAGYEVELVAGVQAAIARLASETPLDLVVCDLAMPDGSGMEVLSAAKRRDEALQVIMITAFATTEQAVEAMRLGAYDYIQKPFKNTELLAQAEKALEKSSIVLENRALRAQVQKNFRVGDLLGKAPRMAAVMDLVRRVASGRSSVLITGESGTGKEMVARALHEAGDRTSMPFITVNCGALPEALMESELFGHEKGAFTGANTRKDGLFRAAQGGTVFLDEIGELPTPLQVKLLRVLQERKVRPVGGTQELEVDVRVVAATNRDVEQAVREGSPGHPAARRALSAKALRVRGQAVDLLDRSAALDQRARLPWQRPRVGECRGARGGLRQRALRGARRLTGRHTGGGRRRSPRRTGSATARGHRSGRAPWRTGTQSAYPSPRAHGRESNQCCQAAEDQLPLAPLSPGQVRAERRADFSARRGPGPGLIPAD
jgi:CheY-like chemotaxis protein